MRRWGVRRNFNVPQESVLQKTLPVRPEPRVSVMGLEDVDSQQSKTQLKLEAAM